MRLTRASDAGVVIVVAAGNDAATELTWPAASRLVIAVGATASPVVGDQDPAAYSNSAPRVDVLAPYLRRRRRRAAPRSCGPGVRGTQRLVDRRFLRCSRLPL